MDLLVIGGGINGAGIARDAAGRGLSVVLCEQADLASGTSSSSSKLIHGGLRYLEQYEFRLVREALAERSRFVQYAILFDRLFRFPLTGSRVRNYDGLGGQLLFAWLHQHGVLHWTDNDGPVEDGQLVLLDMGVEGHELYTADITRTLPVSGTFSPRQRQVYDLVLQAQEAGIAACRAGADFLEPHRAAMQVLAHGLVELGVLESAEAALAEDAQLYRRYTLHGVSHMLGIDVHDCAHARSEVYRKGPLQPGYVLTVEPGLYFQPDDLTVPEDLRGLGVRIEDDILVTDGDPVNLSAALPRGADAVEAWMRDLVDGGQP